MRILRRILFSPSGFVGSVVLLIYLFAALFSPLFAPHAPTKMRSAESLQPPNLSYWAGTDQFGRDIFSRLIYGARISLTVAVTSILLATTIGGLIGATLGYLGGKIEIFSMRFVDILMAFPSLVLALLLVAFFGASVRNIIIAIAVPFTPVFIRMARGSTITLKQKEFCKAAESVGASTPRIIYRHVIPNILPILTAQATLSFSKAILFESSLSFLGLGVQPPTPSWGQMIGAGRQYMSLAPWLTIAPGITISIIVISLNLLGDTLRDATDPYLQHTKT